MRRLILAMAATLSLFAASSFVPERADAMTLPAPAGIHTAIDGTGLAQDVAYICRRVWRCGAYGCGWRQRCGWTSRRWYGRYWYGGRYWQHRYWRRHRWHYY